MCFKLLPSYTNAFIGGFLTGKLQLQMSEFCSRFYYERVSDETKSLNTDLKLTIVHKIKSCLDKKVSHKPF